MANNVTPIKGNQNTELVEQVPDFVKTAILVGLAAFLTQLLKELDKILAAK